MTTSTTDSAAASTSAAGKYLTFKLGSESYGISVLKIREIIRFANITAVPQMPPHVKGVINLRGKIIPVADLRVKFGMTVPTDNAQTCIVVVQIALPAGAKSQIGLIVDAVEEVTSIAAGEVEDAPDFGALLDTQFILGMAKIKGTVKVLLDIDRVLATGVPEQFHQV